MADRIVCLTEEPTEVLYALGEEHRIVGISRFTVRPERARREKPMVSAFQSASHAKILALEPDLVVGFSDVQADIARHLIKAGVEVWISNHRTVAGIVEYVRRLGGMIGVADKANRYADELAANVERVRAASRHLPRRPRVYFEEWNDPHITGIGWVSELIAVAGGDDVFADKATASLAKDRIVADPSEIARRSPDMILASWCGKKVILDQIRARPGWEQVPAIRHDEIHEIDSAIILQPGPAALTDGLGAIHELIARWARGR